ncbi:MAG: nodulation protein NfeD [Nitrospirota bacterium]|nr:nodulation protein NfeD [Nitrospirota bacterium]
MRTFGRWIALSLFLLLALTGTAGMLLSAPEQEDSKPTTTVQSETPKPFVLLIRIDDPITPVIAEYIIKSIDRATEMKAEALIIQMDTPGGLVESTREIVKKMLAAEVPTVVYVAPDGSRAASAGVFITLTANIAAMAPNTRIGSASPVQMEGKMDETMAKKITNDLAAMVRGIAEKRHRNAAWAEEAVRKAVSATETEALKLKVVDLIAPDIQTLLAKIDGKTVDTVMGKKTLHTSSATVKTYDMSFRHRILGIISNPNIAYILMILGFYGLYFELSNPGAIFPGVVGAILLILAFYALQTLPINYAGLMLIILGIVLFIAEAFITSHGVLGVGGAIAMAFGSMMLIDSPEPALQISWTVIAPVVAASALLFIVTLTVAIRAQRSKVDTGKEGLVGLIGEARTNISENDRGQIFVRGEYWNAWSDESIMKGEKVSVVAVDGLRLKVTRSQK